jgi:hypothetical protein
LIDFRGFTAHYFAQFWLMAPIWSMYISNTNGC